MENIVLRDPKSRAKRLQQLKTSCTIGTSGKFVCRPTTLLSCIKIIGQNDIISTSLCIGKGRFGTCYLGKFCHYKVCVKVLRSSKSDDLIHEANILSKFAHQNLPYLFGVRVSDCPSIVTSFHGFNDMSITVHDALFTSCQKVNEY